MTNPALAKLQQAIVDAQGMTVEQQAAHFKQLGMPEVAHLLLREAHEEAGSIVGPRLKELVQHEIDHGQWTRALELIQHVDAKLLVREIDVDLGDVTMKTLVQLGRELEAWMHAEIDRDAPGFARRLCNIRRAESVGFHAIRRMMLMHKPWRKHQNMLAQAALFLVSETPDVSNEQALLHVDQILNQRHLYLIFPFFRSTFRRNIELLRLYSEQRLSRPDPFAGLSPEAVFAWSALVWVYAGDTWAELCEALATLQADTTPQVNTPKGAVLAAAAAYRQRCQMASQPPKPRLRIAMCVFGQLRNYAAGHDTWEVMGLDKHDVKVFVNTWSQTGMRLPDAELGAGVSRVFLYQPFVNAYKRAGFMYGNPALYAAYPGLHAALRCGRVVQQADLQAVYGRDAQCVIEDDPGEAFGPDPGNQRRMFRKMRGAVQMMQESGENFDLCILIRPDLILQSQEMGVDLYAMTQTVAKGPFLYCFEFRVGLNFSVHDVLTIGRPDAIAALVDVESFTEENFWGAPKKLRAHSSIAVNAFSKGLRPLSVRDVKIGGYASEVGLSAERIRQLLLEDIGLRAYTEMDSMLLSSLRH